MTTCEKITWLLSEGERWLRPEYRSCGRSMLHKKSKVEFFPLGVIGAIVSWNCPFHNFFNPMLAAVFSGNSIVIKVSEHASWSRCFYIWIIQATLAAVGAPENLVDVITGFAETGQALASSVDKVIFVGSPGVGRMIMRNAAETLTPATLELGGKDAFIVCKKKHTLSLFSLSLAKQQEMEEKVKLLILCASQTGNATDTAERLCREAERRGCPVAVLSTDDFDALAAS